VQATTTDNRQKRADWKIPVCINQSPKIIEKRFGVMKVDAVLVKVLDPGRLLEAWQQVTKNAGAAGIDQSVPA